MGLLTCGRKENGNYIYIYILKIFIINKISLVKNNEGNSGSK